MGDYLNQCPLGAPRPQPGGAGAGSWAIYGAQLRPSSVCLLANTQWVWLLIGPLTYGAGERIKAKRGCSWVLRQAELFLGLWLRPQSVSLPPGYGSVFSKWLSSFFNTISHLSPTAPTKALLSLNGCQVNVTEGGLWLRGQLVWLFCWMSLSLSFLFLCNRLPQI